MEALENHIKSQRPNLKEITLKSYRSKWKIMKAKMKAAGHDVDASPEAFIQNHDALWEIIQADYSPNSQKTYLAAASGICSVGDRQRTAREGYQHHFTFYSEKLRNCATVQKEQAGKKSQSQMDKWVNIKSLKECQKNYARYLKRNKISQKFIKSKAANGCFYLTLPQYEHLLNYIITSLYLDIAPRRNIYRTCQVIHPIKDHCFDLDKGNWLVIVSRNRKYFLFNDQKNGLSQRLPFKGYLPATLNSALNLWRCLTSDSQLLFPKGNWKGFKPEMYEQTAWTKKVMKAFKPAGLKLGVQMIRCIVATHQDSETKQTMLELQAEIDAHAAAMGHSVNTHCDQYVL